MPSHPHPSSGSAQDIAHVVEHVAHLLPAQGPIGVFIHHNTLHAFEDRPFEDGVVEAGRLLGCQPFLAEEAYHEELRCGRISQRDVEAVLAAALEGRGDEAVVPGLVRSDLWRRLMLHGTQEASGHRLTWLIRETEAVSGSETSELWRACTKGVGRSPHKRAPALAAPHIRHRDLLVAACNLDPDAWTRPVQIRFVGAFLDQGFAHWPLPERERGIYRCFLNLYGRAAARHCGLWAGDLPALIDDDRAAARSAEESLACSLDDLGVLHDEREEFLVQEALALRGWAGMVRHLEKRPDRAPAVAVPARLVDYLAVQLLLSRAALRHAMRQEGIPGPPSQLRATLRARLPSPAPPSLEERAWPLLQAARACGLSAVFVDALPAVQIARLEAELEDIDGIKRRRLLHLAYERRLRHRFYDALLSLEPKRPAETPAFQALFCIDEREESFRRHLEEVEPRVETFASAGFYGVAMYYRGVYAAHARPLCPVAIKPDHFVVEVAPANGLSARWSEVRRALTASVDKNIHLGSRTFGRGAVIAALLGIFWLIPLVLRVLLPWSRRGVSRLQDAFTGSSTRLALDRADGTPPLGRSIGFTPEEMAEIVRGQLAPIGILERLAPLVFVFGHGSTSLNNPQESAHDCGACGGGRGGPNARAFAQMANDPRVRALLAEAGVVIPQGTWVIGGQRNSANNDVDLYDEDLVPDALHERLDNAKRVLEIARRREAHERCRRFEAAPPHWFPEGAALLHVQTRSTDLAQPRPEYGHASNAVCLVGRRSRTRGLFLDRRAFLVSYDPERDADGATLRRVLAAVGPVLVGISLEYFFGYVDPTGYGCGTKLPHNVTGLLGVMDGAQSDLRTGLPWQMLEIHEPVRLTLAVEAEPETLRRVLEQDAYLSRLVRSRWLFLAALHPREKRLFEIGADGVRPYEREEIVPVVRGPSREHYAGRAEHLAFVQLELPAGAPAP
jgi:uncharacterized protein YbcC (UPF0753/DUF2309 family)